MAAKRNNNVELLLASGSPRRRELLSALGVQFRVAPADIDESRLASEAPEAYVQRMAVSKARAGFERTSSSTAWVLGADTAVVLGNTVLGKPRDRDDALRMCRLLSGRTHQVLSGVALLDAQRHVYRLSRTAVSFRAISPSEAEAYWLSGEPEDKAGGYAIQGLGAAFVVQIVGSYSGVVGLPLFETAELLSEFGLNTVQKPS